MRALKPLFSYCFWQIVFVKKPNLAQIITVKRANLGPDKNSTVCIDIYIYIHIHTKTHAHTHTHTHTHKHTHTHTRTHTHTHTHTRTHRVPCKVGCTQLSRKSLDQYQEEESRGWNEPCQQLWSDTPLIFAAWLDLKVVLKEDQVERGRRQEDGGGQWRIIFKS